MAHNKSKEIKRIIGGIIFAVLIIPVGWLMLIGISKLTMYIYERFSLLFSVPIIIIIFMFLIVITAISKANLGGDALKISMRELFKNKKKKNKTIEGDGSN